MQAARRTGWQDPRLLYRAGQLLRKTGDPTTGWALCQQARAAQPSLRDVLDSEDLVVSH